MRKTSVYLPEHLKRALSARATATGRSEADVIRAAVAAEVQPPAQTARVVAQAAPDPPVPGRLVGVGVGPGDPELLTLKAVRALRRADRVMAPATAPDAVGRAEAILREALPDVRVDRVPFTMHPDAGARAQAMQQVAITTVEHLNQGEEVAFVTLGDPLTYSTFSALADAVSGQRPGTTVAVVPGIMAFQSLAARTGTTLVDERQRISIRTALGDLDDLAEDLADATCTTVLYKGGRQLPELTAMAINADRAGPAVIGELLGMPGERIGPLDDFGTSPASYLATVIIPATGHTNGAGREAR